MPVVTVTRPDGVTVNVEVPYLAYTQADGTVAVVVPVVADLRRVAARSVPPGVPHVEVSRLPSRRWRQAWRLPSDGRAEVLVGLAEARSLRAKELEAGRGPALARLDRLVIAAEDAGADASALRARERGLWSFDLDAAVEACADLGALEALRLP